MKLNRGYFIVFSVLLISWNFSLSKYPTDYFDLPLDRDIFLSGTFGELRTGHFHAGIDIKSIERKSGEKVLASASGHIARIKVAPSGYGNAIYIAHPNGYTTVYAHLDRFAEHVAAYVKEKQYALKQFGVDLYLNDNQFQFKKGDLIGYLGNSGSSSGPHLHFEIRRTTGQIPINPFLFGLKITDKLRPDLDKLKVFYLNKEFEQIRVREYPLTRTAPGQYTIADTLSEGAWRAGFAVKTTDKMNGVTNKNGIYELKMAVDDQSQFSFTMDEIPFSKTRYLNAHIDFAAKQNTKEFFHRCFKLPGNALGIYTTNKENGVVNLFANRTQKITIEVSDINKNISTLTFYIKRDTAMYVLQDLASAFSVNSTGELTIKKSNFNCKIIKGALYTQTQIPYSTEPSPPDLYAMIHHIGSEDIPLHKYISISILLEDRRPTTVDNLFIARLEEDKVISYGGQFEDGFLKAQTRDFGAYTIGIDTIPPKIKPVQFNANMQGTTRMRFAITDDVQTSGKADGLSYEAFVDGNWILMEYDAKNDMLTHHFDGHIKPGNHELVLEVTDDRGNKTVLQKSFTN